MKREHDRHLERIGEYRILEVIGQGGMGIVFKAQHQDDRRVVALKLLDSQGLVMHRFGREFRAVRELDHPGIVKVIEWGMFAERPYIVMEYIDGVPLTRFWCKGGTARNRKNAYRKLAETMLKVVNALGYIHARYLVHRDVKPANILVDGDGRPVLMDFGLALRTRTRLLDAAGGELAGSLAYMSPEQMQSRELDGRADLYSLGITLFEILCGYLPFSGESATDLIAQHFSSPVPLVRDIDPSIPAAWDRIIHRLLAKSPADRYQNAAQVSAELIDSFNLDAAPEDRTDDGTAMLLVASYIDAHGHLSRVERICEELTQGTPGVVFISGSMGTGKSRLLSEIRQQCRRLRVRCVNGSCREQGGGALETLAPFLEVVTSADPGAVPREETLLVKRFLGGGLAEQPAIGSQQDLYRFFDAVKELVTVHVRNEPLVLILDDLQWLGNLEAALLKNLVERLIFNQPTGGKFLRGSLPFLMVCAFRPDSGTWRRTSETLATGFDLTRIELQHLSEESAGRLISESLGASAEALTSLLYPLTGGLPLFINQYLTVLIEEKRLLNEGAGWRINLPNGETRALEELRQEDLAGLSFKAEAVVQRRIGLLPGPARALAMKASVAAGAFSFEWLKEMHEGTSEALEEGLDQLLRARILREVIGREETYEFTQQTVKRTVYEHLDPLLVRDLHLRAARAVEKVSGKDQEAYCERLAYHYRRGENPERAVTYLQMSGVRMAGLFNNDDALNQFEQALELTERLRDLDTGRALHTPQWMSGNEELPWILLEHRIGERREESRKQRRREAAMKLLEQMGGVHQISGRFDHAMDSFSQALRIAKEDEAQGEIGSLTRQIGQIHYYKQDLDSALGFFQDALRIQQENGDIRGQANSLNSLGVIAQRRNQLDQALDYFTHTLELREQSGNMLGVAYSHNNIGNIHFYRRNYDEALGCFGTAIDLLQQLDQPLGLAYALTNRAAIHMYQQDLIPMLRDLRRAYQLRHKMGDRRGMLTSLLNLLEASLLLGRIDIAQWSLAEVMFCAQYLGGPEKFPAIAAFKAELNILLTDPDPIIPDHSAEEQSDLNLLRLIITHHAVQGDLDALRLHIPHYLEAIDDEEAMWRAPACLAAAAMRAFLHGAADTAREWTTPNVKAARTTTWASHPAIRIATALIDFRATHLPHHLVALHEATEAARRKGLVLWQATGLQALVRLQADSEPEITHRAMIRLLAILSFLTRSLADPIRTRFLDRFLPTSTRRIISNLVKQNQIIANFAAQLIPTMTDD
ncbi:protein kinase [bacterium]|nr:protein kinase [candidate division CSSED10-310 bacterium]